MAQLPDLDDLLNQIEGSVSAGAPPITNARRGFFDPVPCFSPPSNQEGAAQSGSSMNGSKLTAEAEEKLSFLEFLKVTAKEAEELQRLHDDTQVTRGTKRVQEKKPPATTEIVVGGGEGAVVVDQTRRAPVAAWGPPQVSEQPELPNLPDVPDAAVGQAEGGGVDESEEEGEEAVIALQCHENPVLVCDYEELRNESDSEEEERDEPALLAPVVQHDRCPPTPSPEPCVLAAEEAVLQLQQPVQQGAEPVAAAAAAALPKSEDEELDEVMAYLAQCDAESKAAAAVEPAAEQPVAAAAAAAAPQQQQEQAPPSPIAVTPPSCNTAASFDVVSFDALPTDALDESELERELEELARDFPDSDQPEFARNEERNGTGDETFYSAVESLERTTTSEKREDENEEAEEGGEQEEGEEQPEERQQVDLVFVADPAAKDEERTAEVEDANRERVEASFVIESAEKAAEGADGESAGDLLESIDRSMDRAEIQTGEEERGVTDSPLVSPSISSDSAASLEVVSNEEAAEAAMEEDERKEADKATEEAEVVDAHQEERATVPGGDDVESTVAVVIDRASDDEEEEKEEEQQKPEEDEELLEPMPEFAAVEIMAESGEEAEAETAGDEAPEEEEEEQAQPQKDENDSAAAAAAALAAARAARFRDRVISDVHEIDADEAPAAPSRLTESELQLGKAPPIWIPDAECAACMLCSAKFTFLLRRHHCRACGRVLCSACCNERTVLGYQPDKGKARVCSPCSCTLQRVQQLEEAQLQQRTAAAAAASAAVAADGEPEAPGVEGDAGAAAGEETDGVQPLQQLQVGLDFAGSMRKKSILKVRAASVTSDEAAAAASAAAAVAGGGGASSSAALAIPGGGSLRGGEESVAGSMVGSAPSRGVVFRDGVKPGEHTADERAREEEERAAGGGGRGAPQLRKKSRKRAAVSRRVAALKVEEQLASALPTHARPDLLLVQGGGVRAWSSQRAAELALAAGEPVRIAVNRLLTVTVQICAAPYGEGRVMCAASHGFHALGLDEVVFCWRLDASAIREDEGEGGMPEGEGEEEERESRPRADFPLAVVRRIEEILQSCFTSSELADVRRVATRMPRLHTSIASDADEEAPLTIHTMLVAASYQSTRHLPLSPSLPYVFGVPIRPAELHWALAAPNRVLLRLGLASGCYPTPLIIDPARAAVYSEETSSSVLKMFNDIGTWTYRMQAVCGGTVALANEATIVRIPRHARHQMRKIVEINRNMLAWLCDVNTEADSHLICLETEGGLGAYESNIFQQAGERKKTGATFVIIDGALKTPNARVQVSVCEDGVAVRLPSEGLVELINALLDGKDHSIDSGGHRLRVEWTEDSAGGGGGGEGGQKKKKAAVGTRLLSPIDGAYMGNKMQYGLTLERAISSTLPSPSLPDTATRLSHVFNMRENTIPPEDEAKVFSVAELVAAEAAGMADEHLGALIEMGVDTLAIRTTVERDRIEYEVAEWAGLEEQQTGFRAALDRMVPVFVNVLGYIPHGFSIELWIAIVSTRPLPVEIH